MELCASGLWDFARILTGHFPPLQVQQISSPKRRFKPIPRSSYWYKATLTPVLRSEASVSVRLPYAFATTLTIYLIET